MKDEIYEEMLEMLIEIKRNAINSEDMQDFIMSIIENEKLDNLIERAKL